jgi:uncharacterized protein YdiU (UPF0061 family)
MNKSNLNIDKIGWRFDNTYSRLPKIMSSQLTPIPVKDPKIIILNNDFSKELGLDFSILDDEQLASVFSGNLLPKESKCIAQAYAGHQFGYFTMLGDGRAIILGEHLSQSNKRFDIQFKGSGKTPYSRNADGRAALGPMLREYIISEAMHGLNIPTTRSLAVVTTGENVIRETPLPGAILTRVADSHIRVGTFQYATMQKNIKTLKTLFNYTINRHYPKLKDSNNQALSLLKIVMENQIKLVINWMRVGFIHGVMNTDNMTISGETIDYGPCAFMDTYNPETVFSSIDHQGRYAYCNQPSITQWNLTRFAETLLPIIHSNKDKAIEIATETINDFSKIYKKSWLEMMRKKLGLFGEETEDENLINNLLSWMNQKKTDYTNTFNSLNKEDLSKNKLFQDNNFINWYKKWKLRLTEYKSSEQSSSDLMSANNPKIIPRNYKVEEALNAATNNDDLTQIHNFLKVLKNPYKDHSEIANYQSSPPPSDKIYKTFCGT